MVLGDFHIHSTFSDGQLSIHELVDLYGQRGFGAIAITDHLCETNGILGRAAVALNRTLTRSGFELYLNVIRSEAERAKRQYGMVVIPGIEITKNSFSHADSAHIVVLGISEYISPDIDVISICRAAAYQGALSVAAHPVSTGKIEAQTYFLWDNRDFLSKHIDIWEVASGPVIFNQVLMSGLPFIASSDLHRRGQIASWKTLINCRRDQDSILLALKNQEIELQFYKEEQIELSNCAGWSRHKMEEHPLFSQSLEHAADKAFSAERSILPAIS